MKYLYGVFKLKVKYNCDIKNSGLEQKVTFIAVEHVMSNLLLMCI